MNRLVIIGNGFDLAHGLPTGYCDFIDHYWKNISNSIHEDDFIKINFDLIGMKQTFNDFTEVEKWIESYGNNLGIGWSFELYDNSYFMHVPNHSGSRQKIEILKFKNVFFRIVNQHKNIENWVDIENEYYFQLKKIVKSDEIDRVKKESIKNLNIQFEQVKFLLKKYLEENVENEYDFTVLNSELIEILQSKTYSGNELKEFFKEISKKGENILEEAYQVILEKATGHRNLKNKISKVNVGSTFISFNYTSTMMSYFGFLKTGSFLNEIHGSISDKSNPINFGFGDEMDSHYKQIEETNDNEYLKNIKSFQYLHTPNYKRLLDLIDSDVFQVYIIGHSCGLSDRTLLNTIFEHENCCSIKIFYHQKEDGSDNYTEITQNISRHFNKKALMRERIVDKTLCSPLPQIKLPKKKNKS